MTPEEAQAQTLALWTERANGRTAVFCGWCVWAQHKCHKCPIGILTGIPAQDDGDELGSCEQTPEYTAWRKALPASVEERKAAGAVLKRLLKSNDRLIAAAHVLTGSSE